MLYVYNGKSFSEHNIEHVYNVDDLLEGKDGIHICISFDESNLSSYNLFIWLDELSMLYYSCISENIIVPEMYEVYSEYGALNIYYNFILRDYLSNFVDDIRNLNKDSYEMIFNKVKTTYPLFKNLMDECKNIINNTSKSVMK